MLINALISSFVSVTWLLSANCEQYEQNFISRLLVMTVTESPTSESFMRFNQSVEAFGLDLTVLVLKANENYNDNSLGQQKFKRIRDALSAYKNEPELLIMLVDSKNLIVNGDRKAILDRFNKFGSSTKILFSADSNCWPDSSLQSNYSTTESIGQRYLDSRALIGYAPILWDFINSPAGDKFSIKKSLPSSNNIDNDFQLYSTNVYLNLETRKSLGIVLDHKAELFENLHSTKNDVELEFDLDGVILKNLAYRTNPVVVHGSGSSKIVLNSLGNYLGKAWTQRDGCRRCNSSMISLASIKDSDFPTVLIGIFIEEPTPFLEDFFENVLELNYPTSRIHLFVHNLIDYHAKQVEKFMKQIGDSKYASRQLFNNELDKMTEWEARNYALKKCKQLSCDYYLALDSIARLELPDTLRILIETNRTIVAPLLSRPKKLWSNFWGAITTEGYYSRSHDYVQLVSRERIGVWNVPHIMNAYLIEGKFLKSILEEENSIEKKSTNNDSHINKLAYYDPKYPTVKPTLIFSRNLRSSNVFQFVTNAHEFGHLVDPTSYNISRTHPDFYQLEDNMIDWEQKYLHENYSKLLENDDTHLESPCQDVYWFPLVNDIFCKQMIEIMETFGQWSGGTNDDPRIEGGYESVPTRDIHFKQVGLHEMWLTFLREYVMPIQLKEYIGYEHDPPRTDLAFVVRYNPAEQASLRPHHDSSTYTLNIALNTPGVDYQGGGCRFVRYNCSVTESRRGWALIHPGRLTHYHEGLAVTNGTRYILVTFVDP